jgi:3-oxoacyl-[acyl-carrier-protein] synthase II
MMAMKHPPSHRPEADRIRRSVVTGIGVITPSGLEIGPFWNNVRNGISAAAPITRFDASKLPVRIAAEVKGFNLSNYLPDVKEKRLDRTIQYAVAASACALKDSGLDIQAMDPDRAGVVEGTTISGAASVLKSYSSFINDKTYRSLHPYNIVAGYCGEGSSSISLYLGIQGPVMTYCSGCASGNDAIGYGAKMVQTDELDVVIAGGSDEIVEMLHVGFCKLRSMSERGGDPQAAMRPFDRKRDGFVLGEGAAFVIIEELSHAMARGAKIYAEIVGHGRTAEAHHPTDPHPEGLGYKSALRRAFRHSRVHPEEIDYINAHGSATRRNDPIETLAIKDVFGSHARKLAVSGTKAITGHLMGASGAVESVVTILAVKNQHIPPTINLTEPDEGCDLDYVIESRPYPIRAAVNLNAGFGGRYSCLIFREFRK